MSKRRLTRQQRWRIEKIQAERGDRVKRQDSLDQSRLASGDYGPEREGRVIAHFGRTLEVRDQVNATHHRCHLRANLDSLVTGDRIVWRQAQDDSGVVVAQQARDNVLERPDARGQLKPVAANIDQILIVFATEPAPYPNLIDRYLVAAEATGISPVLVLNKIDLLPESGSALLELLESYAALGYPIIRATTQQEEGLEALYGRLAGRTSVFVGQSGVGKSSLIAQLLPEETLRIGTLSEESRKGTHTTTTARLYDLPGDASPGSDLPDDTSRGNVLLGSDLPGDDLSGNGLSNSIGELIDSPGIREFGLIHLDEQSVTQGFVEFRPYLGHCRFRDCRHQQEPGCALLEAVANGAIRESRLASYRHIIKSLPNRSQGSIP